MNFDELRDLGKALVKATPSAPVAYSFGEVSLSYNDLNETFNKELNELVGDYYKYELNKAHYFQLMSELITEYLPKKVMQQYGQFAETKQYAQGDKPVFIQRVTQHAKRRAKAFVSRVGLDGIYEVFKLDGKKIEVQTAAYGAACQVTLEEVLDGRMNLQEMLDIVMEGIDDLVYAEIEKALISAVNAMPVGTKNKYTSSSGFEEAEFDKLIQIADSYGKSTIYCTYEFAAKMLPATGWVSNEMKNQKWTQGYLGSYKGHSVVVLEQSFTDETNSKKVINPKYAWIIPSGSEKPVKIAFEGQAIVREHENKDGSKEIQIYQKFGVGSIIQNNICVYIDNTLTQ